MGDLSALEALSGAFGSVSLASWILVLVNNTSSEMVSSSSAYHSFPGAAIGRKLQSPRCTRYLSCFLGRLVCW